MTRVKKGVARSNKHHNIFNFSKGYTGRRRNVFKISKQAILKSFFYSYRDRKVRKRIFRSSWILFINSCLRIYNFSYNFFIHFLNIFNIFLNRKSLFFLFTNFFNFIKFFSILFFYYYFKF